MGGSDDPSNLAELCNGCHDTMHSFAVMLGNPKKCGLVNDHMQTVWPNRKDIHSRCLELAFLVHNEFQKRKENGKLLDVAESVSFMLPAEFKAALRILGNETKWRGNKMGITRYTQFLILEHLASKFPYLKTKIVGYIETDNKKNT